MTPPWLPWLLVALAVGILAMRCLGAYIDRQQQRLDDAHYAEFVEQMRADLDAPPTASDTAIDAALSTPLEFTLDGEPLLPPSDPVADWHAEGGPVFANDDLD